MRRILGFVVIGLFFTVTPNVLAVTTAQKCEIGRLKARDKFESCVGKWMAAYYGGKGLNEEGFAKCRSKHAATWPKLQTLVGTACDAPRFVDNLDGTISDNLTGLVWEIKTTAPGSGANFADPRDVDNDYTLSTGAPYNGDGTAYTSFLAGLNASCFANHCDWRLPTATEIETIVLPEPYPCVSNPCIDPIFGVVAPDDMFSTSYYWSSTTVSDLAGSVWIQHFRGTADVNINLKDGLFSKARAVRGGF